MMHIVQHYGDKGHYKNMRYVLMRNGIDIGSFTYTNMGNKILEYMMWKIKWFGILIVLEAIIWGS